MNDHRFIAVMGVLALGVVLVFGMVLFTMGKEAKGIDNSVAVYNPPRAPGNTQWYPTEWIDPDTKCHYFTDEMTPRFKPDGKIWCDQ